VDDSWSSRRFLPSFPRKQNKEQDRVQNKEYDRVIAAYDLLAKRVQDDAVAYKADKAMLQGMYNKQVETYDKLIAEKEERLLEYKEQLVREQSKYC
jgi:DNA mismatch repair ATPase MutS